MHAEQDFTNGGIKTEMLIDGNLLLSFQIFISKKFKILLKSSKII